jgi:hypothetical protein
MYLLSAEPGVLEAKSCSCVCRLEECRRCFRVSETFQREGPLHVAFAWFPEDVFLVVGHVDVIGCGEIEFHGNGL